MATTSPPSPPSSASSVSQTDPVPAGKAGQPTAPSRSWPAEALPLAQQLQRNLSISERDWHALKTQRCRRGAEQIAAALVVLLTRDQPAQSQSNEARQQAIALLEHALGWLKAEISDPGCPSHGR